MRVAIFSFLILAACADEPSFDEQFERQSADIQKEAQKVERDLKAQIELVPAATEAEKLDTPGEKASE